MTWTSDIYSNNSDTTTFNEAQNGLNKLTDAQYQSVKLATSDEHDGSAHSVIIYLKDPPATAPVLPAGQNWLFESFKDGTYSTAVNNAVNFLNGAQASSGASIIAVQAYHARVTANDHKSGDPVITVWYLTDQV